MNEQLPKEGLVSSLRAFALQQKPFGIAKLLNDAADCIEQLQMPPAKIRELAECDEGADSLALMRALGVQIEGQRKHIATLQDQREHLRGLIEKHNQECPVGWRINV